MLTQVDRPIVKTTKSAPSIGALKLYGDGASLADFSRLHSQGRVTGFTTNPTLMFKAGITDYVDFAHQLIALIPDMPLSFEVFSDDFAEMERQESLSEDILRTMTIRVDELEEGPSAMLQKRDRDERDGAPAGRGDRGGFRGGDRGPRRDRAPRRDEAGDME